MASSQSTGGKYANITFFKQENFPLLAKQMLMKQQNVNVAKATLEQFNNKMGTDLRAAKDEDKEYILNRATQARGLINESLRNGLDLSDENNLVNLRRQFRNVVDENVYNAVSSLRKREAEEADWQKIKEENPEKYNEANYAIASKNWQNYMQSEGVGNKYSGGGGVIEYVDVQKRLMDPKFMDYLDNIGVDREFIKMAQAEGDIMATINTYEGMREEDKPRLRNAIKQQIGRDGYRQLRINAWEQYGEGDDVEMALQFSENYVENRQEQIDDFGGKLKTIKQELKAGNYNKDQEKAAKETVKRLEGTIKRFEEDRDKVGNMVTPQGVNKQLYQQLTTQKYIADFEDQAFGTLFRDPILTDTNLAEKQWKQNKHEKKIKELFEKRKGTQQRGGGAFATGQRQPIGELTVKNHEEQYAETTDKALKNLESFIIPEGVEQEGENVYRLGGKRYSFNNSNTELILTEENGEKTRYTNKEVIEDIRKGLTNNFVEGEGINNLTEGQTTLLMTKMDDDNFFAEVSNKGYVDLEGTRIDLKREGAFTALMELQGALTGNNEMGKNIKKNLSVANNQVFDKLQESVGTEQLTALSESLEDLAFTNENGAYKLKGRRYQEGVGNLEYLLNKENRTEDEQATLDVYSTLLLANSEDSGLSDFDKEMLINGMKEDLLSESENITAASINSIPESLVVKNIEQAQFNTEFNFLKDNPVTALYDVVISPTIDYGGAFIRGSYKELTGDRTPENTTESEYIKTSEKRTKESKKYLTNRLYNSVPGIKESIKGVGKTIEDMTKQAEEDISQSSLRTIQIPYEYEDGDGEVTEDFKKIRDHLGIPRETETSIMLSPHTDNPDVFDVYVSTSISNSVKLSDDKRKSFKLPGWEGLLDRNSPELLKTVTREEINSIGLGSQLSDVKGVSFNANDTSPRKLELGSSATWVNKDVPGDARNAGPTDLFYENKRLYETRYKEIEQQGQLTQEAQNTMYLLNEYEAGRINFEFGVSRQTGNYGITYYYQTQDGREEDILAQDFGMKQVQDAAVEQDIFSMGLQNVKDDVFLKSLGFGQ